MIDDILHWIGAADQLITTMGPIVALALSCVGGYGVTQALKFPIAQFSPPAWSDWTIRSVSVVATAAFAGWSGKLPIWLCALAGVAQPFLYGFTMAFLRRRWPWLEATKTLGSAIPSSEAVEHLQARQQ